MDAVSHAQNPNVLRRARDLYATYCASSDGKNYQGLPCPAWDALTEAVRGHWYTVALRAMHLGHVDSKAAGGMAEASGSPPSDYAIGHLPDCEHALEVWRRYSGLVL
jgi:hypothetical protein